MLASTTLAACVSSSLLPYFLIFNTVHSGSIPLPNLFLYFDKIDMTHSVSVEWPQYSTRYGLNSQRYSYLSLCLSPSFSGLSAP